MPKLITINQADNFFKRAGKVFQSHTGCPTKIALLAMGPIVISVITPNIA